MRILETILLCAFLVPSFLAPLSAQPLIHSQSQVAELAELKHKIQGDNRHNPLGSVRWAEEALAKLATQPDSELELWFLTRLVGDLNVLSDYPKAEAYLEQGRRLAARSGDRRGGFLLEIEAAALFEDTEKNGEAKLLLDGLLPPMASFRAKNLQDRELGGALARGHRIQGGVLQTMGRYPNAIAAYQKAQKVCEELGDRRQQSIVLDKMGSMYKLLGRPKEAVASHLQAIQMAEAISDMSLQAAFHLDLASTYQYANDSEAQLAELKQAVDLAGKAKDVRNEIAGLMNLADAYIRKKEYQAALHLADAALKLPGVLVDPGNVAVCMINRGISLNRLGNSTEGLKAIQEGLRHTRTTQAKSEIASVLGDLAEEYAFAGDYRRAFETEREFKTVNDELKRSEDQKQIAEASAAFESDKKLIQIEGLQREQRVQARLKMLWIALIALGFSVAGVLVISRKKLQQVNAALSGLNDQNLDLIAQLQLALSEVQTLQGLIPICSYCKKIREDGGAWSQMEMYISSRSKAQFSHGICPDCLVNVRDELANLGIQLPNENLG